KRRRTALWCSVSLFGLSVLVLVVGLLSATQTDNVAVSGYYPGIILSFGAFLGIVGLNLVENRRPMVSTTSPNHLEMALWCILDRLSERRNGSSIQLQPLASRKKTNKRKCSHPKTIPSIFSCQTRLELQMGLTSINTCYCCDLFHCDSVDYRVQYYEFTGVSSCWDVVNLYRLLWACVTLNVLGVFLGIITAAVLGAFKDLVSLDSSDTNNDHPLKIAYKFVIMLYYHQILDSIFLPTCFLSAQVLYFFLELINHSSLNIAQIICQ
uniref:Transmembrane protein 255B n=1 Tax=Sinocyclocheilus anshuiensis TaxID=1608454 RepID=A0A671PH97_9TELE